jgi:hypothetical protein
MYTLHIESYVFTKIAVRIVTNLQYERKKIKHIKKTELC